MSCREGCPLRLCNFQGCWTGYVPARYPDTCSASSLAACRSGTCFMNVTCDPWPPTRSTPRAMLLSIIPAKVTLPAGVHGIPPVILRPPHPESSPGLCCLSVRSVTRGALSLSGRVQGNLPVTLGPPGPPPPPPPGPPPPPERDDPPSHFFFLPYSCATGCHAAISSSSSAGAVQLLQVARGCRRRCV